MINLLFSGGFEAYTKLCSEQTLKFRSKSWAAGVVHGRAPFIGSKAMLDDDGATIEEDTSLPAEALDSDRDA